MFSLVLLWLVEMLNRNGIVSEKESGGWVATVATSVNGCGRNAVGFCLDGDGR